MLLSKWQVGVVFAALIALACQSSVTVERRLDDTTEVQEDEVIDENGEPQERIFIVDKTGKQWDITHAVSKYGFDKHKFQFGLGPNAIPPILKPEFIRPGENGYPDQSDGFLMMGVNLEEDARAYPLSIMSSHEVVDDRFEETFVAVAY